MNVTDGECHPIRHQAFRTGLIMVGARRQRSIRYDVGGSSYTESDTVPAGVRKRRPVMKFASFENVLMLATLALFAVFLVWSVKIIAAWA